MVRHKGVQHVVGKARIQESIRMGSQTEAENCGKA